MGVEVVPKHAQVVLTAPIPALRFPCVPFERVFQVGPVCWVERLPIVPAGPLYLYPDPGAKPLAFAVPVIVSSDYDADHSGEQFRVGVLCEEFAKQSRTSLRSMAPSVHRAAKTA